MLLSNAERIGCARTVLEQRGLAPPELLSAEIAESWMRCLAAGHDPGKPPSIEVAGERELRELRQKHDLVRRLALVEMHNLYHQIAGTNFMIAFAAPDGMLLDTISDSSFRAAARSSCIRPGSLWAEASCGTNGMGTVAHTGRAVTVHGGEHFFSRYGALTCTAAPIFSPAGELAGVLDASSDCGSRQQHTQALVSMAATQIQNSLFRDCHAAHIVVEFHSRGEYLHTLSAGLLALDLDGVVLGANTQACFLLHGLPALPGRRFEELFRAPLSAFLETARRNGRQRLEDLVGSAFVASIDNLRSPTPQHAPTPAARKSPVGFVADDPIVAKLVREVELAALRRIQILICGETGTGKEQLARHAHSVSRRRGAFVPVNCAALPDGLAEAELFGHADGAFTGARRGGAPGLIVEADGGTLFLDEIGDMPLQSQAVLLRFLDDWTVRPVGGGRPRQVDVLLLAGTNANLERAVATGRFRADLFYRLNTIEVTLPSLIQRQDFAAIVHHVLAGVAPGCQITADAISRLAERSWPGNIRELRSALTRITLTEPDRIIDAASLNAQLPDEAMAKDALAGVPRLRQETRERIVAAHRATAGNVSETARRLGVSRNTIYRALGNQSDD